MATHDDQLRAIEVMAAHSAAVIATLERVRRLEEGLRVARERVRKLPPALAPGFPIMEGWGPDKRQMIAPDYVTFIAAEIDKLLKPLEKNDG